MIGPWRFFHNPEHIFDVRGDEDAIEVIAALFHDIVYVQVDHSINFNVRYYITIALISTRKLLLNTISKLASFIWGANWLLSPCWKLFLRVWDSMLLWR